MWENIVVVLILVLCAYFVGRRFFRQVRRAVDKDSGLNCGGDCAGCSSPKKLQRKTDES